MATSAPMHCCVGRMHQRSLPHQLRNALRPVFNRIYAWHGEGRPQVGFTNQGACE